MRSGIWETTSNPVMHKWTNLGLPCRNTAVKVGERFSFVIVTQKRNALSDRDSAFP